MLVSSIDVRSALSDTAVSAVMCLMFCSKLFLYRFFDMERAERILRGEREVRFSVHADLLHPTRKLFRDEFPDCRLETVEEYIPTFSRGADVPGYLVPVYYQRYLLRKDLEILRPVVEHNTLDVANLACLLNYETEMLYG